MLTYCTLIVKVNSCIYSIEYSPVQTPQNRIKSEPQQIRIREIDEKDKGTEISEQSSDDEIKEDDNKSKKEDGSLPKYFETMTLMTKKLIIQK